MVQFIAHSIWRLFILALGIGSIFIAISVFPLLNSTVSTVISLLILYSVFAYFVIPFLIRLLRKVIKPDHIPLYVTTRDGWPSDPVTIAVVAKSRHDLRKAMNKAGWFTADKLTFMNGLREVISIIFNTSYARAPLSHLYLFNRHHDIGFEIPTNQNMSARTRHHVRFWRLEEPRIKSEHGHRHYRFWLNKLKHLLRRDRELWIGAATEETTAIAIQWHSGQLTHGGSDDAIRERDFIIDSLKKAGMVARVTESEPGEKLKFRGQQFRTFYVTDGALKIIELH